MDYDLSNKFISSLAKFLQSLCNGYVEFDNGVQVIGHLYLSVDTGKTIDYVLNEKISKTDENSVTFISNSFHAQPAEKPKPEKRSESNETDPKPEELRHEEQSELRSTNAGTVPGGRVPSSNTLAGNKRPYSPSSQKQNSDPTLKQKRSRSDLDQTNSSHLTAGAMSGANPVDPSNQPSNNTAHSFDDPYQQSAFPGDDGAYRDEEEQRDIKPSFDTDVTFIKEEYGPSSNLPPGGQDEGNQGDNYEYSDSYPNQSFNSSSYVGQGSFSSNQRSIYNPAGIDPSMYGAGSSQLEGGGSDMMGDPSGAQGQKMLKSGRPDRKRFQCDKCLKRFTYDHTLTRHKWQCEGTRVLECPVCGKILHRRDKFQLHMKTHQQGVKLAPTHF